LEYGVEEIKMVKSTRTPNKSNSKELNAIEAKMWTNYDKATKLIKQRGDLKYNDPDVHTLTEKINKLNSERKQLNVEWKKVKSGDRNTVLQTFGFKEKDRVKLQTIGLFNVFDDIISGTVVMYRGKLTVKLDDPSTYKKKYVPLSKRWWKEK